MYDVMLKFQQLWINIQNESFYLNSVREERQAILLGIKSWNEVSASHCGSNIAVSPFPATDLSCCFSDNFNCSFTGLGVAVEVRGSHSDFFERFNFIHA